MSSLFFSLSLCLIFSSTTYFFTLNNKKTILDWQKPNKTNQKTLQTNKDKQTPAQTNKDKQKPLQTNKHKQKTFTTKQNLYNKKPIQTNAFASCFIISFHFSLDIGTSNLFLFYFCYKIGTKISFCFVSVWTKVCFTLA